MDAAGNGGCGQQASLGAPPAAGCLSGERKAIMAECVCPISKVVLSLFTSVMVLNLVTLETIRCR